MHKRLFLTGLLGLSLCAAPFIMGEPQALAKGLPAEPANFTLDVALATAMRNNPDIQAAEAKLRQAKIEKENQDLWWARTIRANANYSPFGGNFGQTNVTADGVVLPTAAIGLGFNLGDVLAGPKNSKRAEEAITIAEAELKKTTLNVAASVTAAYQEYQAAKEIAAIGDDVMAAASADVKVAERQFAQGAMATNGLVNARLAVARAKADRVQTVGSVAKSWTNLLNLMGTTDWVPGQEKGN